MNPAVLSTAGFFFGFPENGAERAAVLLTRTPVAERNGEVGSPDEAIGVRVGGAVISSGTWSPSAEQQRQVERADFAVAIQVCRAARTLAPTAQ